jgi:copper chaperone CopZ
VAAFARRVRGVTNVEIEGQRVLVTYDPAHTSPEEIVRGIEASRVDQVSKVEPL